MPCDARKMKSELIGKLGAVEEPGRSHMKYRVYWEDQLIGLTEISYGAKEIPDNLVSSMAHELCIPAGVLRKIYQCPYSWDEYQENYDPGWNPRIPYRIPWE